MNICLATCKEIHHHINHLMSINTSDEMIIESLKAKFTLEDINFMDIQHRFTILKHEYARKKIVVSNHLDHAFHNNDFHDGHKEVVKQIYDSIYNNDISSKEFSEKIKVEYDFAKFYVSFLDLVKGDHGEPTPRAYKIADEFVSDRINNSVIEESKNSKSEFLLSSITLLLILSDTNSSAILYALGVGSQRANAVSDGWRRRRIITLFLSAHQSPL